MFYSFQFFYPFNLRLIKPLTQEANLKNKLHEINVNQVKYISIVQLEVSNKRKRISRLLTLHTTEVRLRQHEK